jgi:PAS domain S-box-containing protein
LLTVLDASPDAAVIADVETQRLLYVNSAFEKLSGFERGEVLGRTASELNVWLGAHDGTDIVTAVNQALEREGSFDALELTVRDKSGSIRWIQFSVQLLELDGRPHALAVIRDLTQLKRTEDELRQTLSVLRSIDDQRRGLLARLVRAQEDERHRIAADIHDDSIQHIAAALLDVSLLRKRARGRYARQIERLEGSLGAAVARLRTLTFELWPPALDRGGLVSALEAYVDRFAAEDGLLFRIDDRMVSDPPREVRVILYRIAQEALTNVRKHARAASVDIVLEEYEAGYLLRIRDDGVGFEPADPDRSSVWHLGLATMRERAEMAGGWWKVMSLPGSGTTIEAWVPTNLPIPLRRPLPAATSEPGAGPEE